MKPVHHQSACELLQAQEAGELSAVRITEACLDRIGKLDGSVHAFISVRPERALEQAKSIDER
ncbi:MAG: hypothetical protein AMK75_03875, partial [Planctomycetes bacterium SM23_65]